MVDTRHLSGPIAMKDFDTAVAGKAAEEVAEDKTVADKTAGDWIVAGKTVGNKTVGGATEVGRARMDWAGFRMNPVATPPVAVR